MIDARPQTTHGVIRSPGYKRKQKQLRKRSGAASVTVTCVYIFDAIAMADAASGSVDRSVQVKLVLLGKLSYLFTMSKRHLSHSLSF